MDAPVTLLLVVSLSGGDVRLGQLRATLAAQLDPRQVRLLVRRADGVPSLDQRLDAAAEQGPVAVVTNPRRGRFELRVALKPTQWVRRSFTFAGGDPVRERNRTVALAIASMTPEWRLPEPLPELEAEPEPEPAVVPPLGDSEPLVEAPDAGLQDASALPPPPEPVAPADAGEEEDPLAELPALDAGRAQLRAPAAVRAAGPSGLQVDVAAAFMGWPWGGGAQLGAHYCAGAFCVGLLVRGQQASLGVAQAEVQHAGGQLIGRLQRRLGPAWLGGALQLGVGPGWVLARRAGQTQERWQLETELAPEVWVRPFDVVALFLRVGVALTSGPTPVFVNGVQVTELPIASAQATAGLRFGR